MLKCTHVHHGHRYVLNAIFNQSYIVYRLFFRWEYDVAQIPNFKIESTFFSCNEVYVFILYKAIHRNLYDIHIKNFGTSKSILIQQNLFDHFIHFWPFTFESSKELTVNLYSWPNCLHTILECERTKQNII